ncbi:MAG: hypothetical protein WDW38_004488 [Sanguina aurantia]
MAVDVPMEGGVEDAAPDAAKPVESSKRERKQSVDVYKVEVKDTEEFTVKQGKGIKIGDIPNATHQLSKLRSDDDLVTHLHLLLHKRTGTANKRKRNILAFSGFVFGDQEAKENEKVKEKLTKWTLPLIHQSLDMFDLPRGTGDDSKKESKVARLFTFLDKPQQLSDKSLAETEVKKREAAKAKRERSTAVKEKKAAKKKGSTPASKTKAPKKDKMEVEGEDDADNAEEAEAEEVEEEESDEEEEEAPAAKKAKKVATPKGSQKKAAEDADAACSPAAATAAGSSAAATAEKAPAEAPGSAKASRGSAAAQPSDEDLKAAVSEVLKDVAVGEINVRALMKSLKVHYKGVDLSSKKDLIKSMAMDYIKVITDRTAAEEAAAAAEAEEEAVAAEEAVAEPAGEAVADETGAAPAAVTADAAPPAVAEPTEAEPAAAPEPEAAASSAAATEPAAVEAAAAAEQAGASPASDGEATAAVAVESAKTHAEPAHAEEAATAAAE